MSTENRITEWIKEQQDVIDLIISEAGHNFVELNKNKPNFSFEIQECQAESFNLICGQDLCYDRYCTPFVYSLWYHARRLNTFLSFFTKSFINSDEEFIEIFDLGSGTGAVQFAAALSYLGMKKFGLKTPKLRIINIDSSPFMLDYNNKFLWPTFLKYYPELNSNDFQIEYSVNSWNVNIEKRATNPWITASYLFDISDNKEIIAKDFINLINTYIPTTVLLLTSNQNAKVDMLKSVLNSIKTESYNIQEINETSLLFKGYLKKVNSFRLNLNSTYSGRGLSSYSTWNDSSFIGTILKKRAQTLNFIEEPKDLYNINLYNPKIKVRKDINLNEQQRRASQFIGRPSLIVGPAGSGKSVVITEKIKNIVESQYYNPQLKILVTSFNKALIKKLGDWMEQLLTQGKFERIFITPEASHFKFKNSQNDNISLLHFDLLPTRLGNIKPGILKRDMEHLEIINKCIQDVKKERKIDHNRFDNVLNEEFIYTEYQRIFYGLDIKSREQYLNISRRGMWQALNKERRDIVYDCIYKYSNYIHVNKIDSFVTRRRLFLKKLTNGEVKLKYDYILVDEFQDCTKADFDIFLNLIKDVNNFTFGGDLAQAINIGKSADVPKDERMKRKEKFLLEGSYRLPQRISESIKTLSTTIVSRWKENEGVKEIEPVKNSPPGSRPIVVFGENMEQISLKIKDIYETYKIYDLTTVTILEKDKELCSSLRNLKVPAETDTILRLKGLEKDCILWGTRINVDDEKEVYEFIYTILTRTSSILIIALSNSTNATFKRVIGLLDRERLIMWDSSTKSKFDEFCEQYVEEISEDD